MSLRRNYRPKSRFFGEQFFVIVVDLATGIDMLNCCKRLAEQLVAGKRIIRRLLPTCYVAAHLGSRKGQSVWWGGIAGRRRALRLACVRRRYSQGLSYLIASTSMMIGGSG